MSVSNEVKIGQLVRSYDFFGRMDCYLEGVVESIDGAAATFTAKVTKEVFGGEELRRTTAAFTTDLPGMNWLDDQWTNRIEWL